MTGHQQSLLPAPESRSGLGEYRSAPVSGQASTHATGTSTRSGMGAAVGQSDREDSGEALRDAGVARVSANHPTLFSRLLAEAIRVSREQGEAHADDVRAYAMREGLAVPSKLFGAVWARRGWRRIGTRASAYPGCHGHKSGRYVWCGE